MSCMMLKRFARGRRGSVLPTFAIVAVPLIVASGGVIDYTNAYDQRTIVQDAMDWPPLPPARRSACSPWPSCRSTLTATTPPTSTTRSTTRRRSPPPSTVSTITLTTVLVVPTYFLGMIGLDHIDFNLKSQATLALGTLEVALALDNSGSMNTDNNIATLRTAATDLVDDAVQPRRDQHRARPGQGRSGSVRRRRQRRARLTATPPGSTPTAIGTYHADSMDSGARPP